MIDNFSDGPLDRWKILNVINQQLCDGSDVLPINGPLPVAKVVQNRTPEVRNILRKLSKVRRYLKQSTNANLITEWELMIQRGEIQLVKAEARASNSR